VSDSRGKQFGRLLDINYGNQIFSVTTKASWLESPCQLSHFLAIENIRSPSNNGGVWMAIKQNWLLSDITPLSNGDQRILIFI
jgi:hypothetical protein